MPNETLESGILLNILLTRILKLKTPLLTLGSGLKSGAFGAVALFAVIFYASGIPRIQKDILQVRDLRCFLQDETVTNALIESSFHWQQLR